MKKGKFIVLEGLDGSGKGTQYDKIFDYLCQWCIDTGQHALGDCEPTNGLIGKTIREYLKKDKVDNVTLMHLFTADRNEHSKAIKETLDKGTNVLLDRYWYSTYAYQTVDNPKLGNYIWDTSQDFVRPDIVFFIDAPVEVCLDRINKRDSQKEVFEKKEYLEKVKKQYDIVMNASSSTYNNVYYINGNQSEEKVFEDIKKILEEKLK